MIPSFTGWEWIFIVLYPLLLILILSGMRLLTGKIDSELDHFREEIPSRNLQIFGFELLSDQGFKLLVKFLLRFYRIFIYLFTAYLFTVLFLSLLPHTRMIARRMFNFISDPFFSFIVRLFDFIPVLIAAVVAFIAVGILMRFVDFILIRQSHELSRLPFISEEMLIVIDKLAKPIILVAGILFVLSYLPEVGGKVVAYSLAGIGVLAIVSLIRVSENIVADIVISYCHAFKEKDHIQVGEFSGEVVERNFLGIKVLTSTSDEVVIPNRNFLRSSFIRKSPHPQNSQRIEIYFNLGRDIKPQWGESSLLQSIRQTEGIDLQQPYKVLITDLNDAQVKYKISAVCMESADIEAVKSNLYFTILTFDRDPKGFENPSGL